jgi:hypothetical protein
MHAARRLGASVVGHEERYLVTMIEIIEIHIQLLLRKREHGWSLRRTIAHEKARPISPFSMR